MKNKLKYLLVICIAMFMGCNKEFEELDEIVENPRTRTETIVKVIDRNEWQTNPSVAGRISEISYQKKESQNQTGRMFDNGVFIDEEQVKYIEDGDYHSYTFRYYDPEHPNLTENLVMSLQEDGTYKEFIMSYYLNDKQKQELTSGLQITGDYQITRTDIGSNYSNGLLSRNADGSQDCSFTSVEYHTTPDTGETFVLENPNQCQHMENGQTQCAVHYVVVIDCPVPIGGGGDGSGGTGDLGDTGGDGGLGNGGSGPDGNNDGNGTNEGECTNCDLTTPFDLLLAQQLNEQFPSEWEWEIITDVPDDAPSFDTIEELIAFINSLSNGQISGSSAPTGNQTQTMTTNFRFHIYNQYPHITYFDIDIISKPREINNGVLTQEWELTGLNSQLTGWTVPFTWTPSASNQVSYEFVNTDDGPRVVLRKTGILFNGITIESYKIGVHVKYVFYLYFDPFTGEPDIPRSNYYYIPLH